MTANQRWGALAGALVFAAGCFPGGIAPAAPQPPVCMPTAESEPLDVPALLRLGASRRDEALQTEAQRSITGQVPPNARVWDVPLRDARDCYQQALELSPNNYEANLGIGIVFLTAAQRESRPERINVRNSYLSAAKRHFGEAYFSRQAPHDPLYYLAVVAVLYGEFEKAEYLTQILIRDNVKAGEAHALLGYMAEVNRRPDVAAQHYDQALVLGASVETLEFVMERRGLRR